MDEEEKKKLAIKLMDELEQALNGHMQLAVKLKPMGRPVPDFGHRARRIVAKWRKANR